MSFNVIEVENLSYRYDKEPVLNDISFSVAKGEFVILTGENGAAKTTLLKNILGIYRPESGSAQVIDMKPKLSVGYVPQNVTQYNESFPSTVYELTQSGRYAEGNWFKRLTAEDHREVKEALEKVGLYDYRDQAIGDLSGGQKQRLSLARILAMDPDIYILDEPTTGMDAASRWNLYEILREKTKEGKSVLMVTHEQDEMKKFADRHFHLVREEGTPWRCFTLNSCKGPC